MVYTNLAGSIYRQPTTAHKESVNVETKIYKTLLLEQYKEGSSLEGTLNKIESGYVLELPSGICIPVSILDKVEIGKLLKFIVQNNIEGKLHLTLAQSSNQDIIKKVMENLKLPQSQEMDRCVTQFMEKNLPLSKESINQTYYLHKHYKIPTEVIINMLAKSSPISSKALESFNYLKNHGIEDLMGQIKSTLLEEQDIVRQLKIINVLLEQLDEMTIKEFIKEHVHQEHTYPRLNKEDKELIIKEILQQLEPIVEQAEGMKGIVEWQKINQLMKIIPLLGDKINSPEIGIRELIEKLYDCINYVGDKVSSQHMRENILEKGKLLSRLIEKLGEQILEAFSPQEQDMIKESLKALHRLSRDGEYFIFPFIYHQQVNRGEAYFFKPSRKQPKVKEHTYIVVALDMEYLKHIEVHINKIDRQISLHIVTESQEIQSYVVSQMEKLVVVIQQMNYQVDKCSYSIKEEKSLTVPKYEASNNIKTFDMKI